MNYHDKYHGVHQMFSDKIPFVNIKIVKNQFDIKMKEKKFDPKKLEKLNNPQRLMDIPPDFMTALSGSQYKPPAMPEVVD